MDVGTTSMSKGGVWPQCPFDFGGMNVGERGIHLDGSEILHKWASASNPTDSAEGSQGFKHWVLLMEDAWQGPGQLE